MSEKSYNLRSEKSYNPRSERSYGKSKHSDRFDDSYSEKTFTTDRNFSEKNYKPPTYREALRYEDSESSADEKSFVLANETTENEPKVFVERVITPRAKPKESPKVLPKFGRAPPPPEEDVEYDSIEPKRLQKKALVDKAVDPASESETDESDTENESEEESESEEASEEEEEPQPQGVKGKTPDYVYSKLDKSKGGGNQPEPQVGFRPPASAANGLPAAQAPAPPPQQQFQAGLPYPGAYPPPGLQHPQPQYPVYPGQPMAARPPFPPAYPQGYNQPYFPGQQQPQGYMPPSNPPQQPSLYNQANFTVPLNPPQGAQRPVDSNSKHGKPNMGPKNAGQPPVYSYLVNRGYQPMDGRHSPLSSSTGASHHSGDRKIQNDDSDYSANIGSGVELLKRK